MDIIRKMTPHRNKIIATILCLAIVITGIHYTSEKEEIYGDVANTMTKEWASGANCNFNIKGENGTVKTTYSDNGYKTLLKVLNENGTEPTPPPADATSTPAPYQAYVNSSAQGTADKGKVNVKGVYLSTSIDILSDSNYAKVTYTVENRSGIKKRISVATIGDTCIDSDDRAQIDNLSGNRGFVMSNDSYNFTLLLRDSYGVTNVDSYWYGAYNKWQNYIWASGTDESSVYSTLNPLSIPYDSRIDSAMSFAWKNREIESGKTLKFSFLLGVGDPNNPPEIKSIKLNGRSPETSSSSAEWYVTDKTNMVIEGRGLDIDASDTVNFKYSITTTGDEEVDYGEFEGGFAGGEEKDFKTSFRLDGNGLGNRKYKLNIFAVDSRGAISAAKSFYFIYKPSNWLNAKRTNAIYGINLDWSPGGNIDTAYKLYRDTNTSIYTSNKPSADKMINANNFSSAPASGIRILNIYPELNSATLNSIGNSDGLSDWMADMNAKKPDYYPSINVSKMTLYDFNQANSGNNNSLKTGTKWNYDVVVFGFWDTNGSAGSGGKGYSNDSSSNDADLSADAAKSVEDFIKAGNGVIFGHDTIFGGTHPNFYSLRDYVGIKDTAPGWVSPMDRRPPYGAGAITGNYVELCRSSLFSTIPFNVEGEMTSFQDGKKAFGPIPPTHYLNHRIYDENDVFLYLANAVDGKIITHIGDPNAQYEEGQNNGGQGIDEPSWYLIVHKNCAMIQTGHSSGQSTEQERKIIANLIYYLYPYASTSVYDPDAVDKARPDNPTVTFDPEKSTNDSLKYKVRSRDNGTTYYYSIRMYDKSNLDDMLNKANTSCMVKSNLASIQYCITKGTTIPTTQCDQPITWGEAGTAGNHLEYEECTRCGNKMKHSGPAPIRHGYCANGHWHAVWLEDHQTAWCENRNCSLYGQRFTYDVPAPTSFAQTCDNDVWNSMFASNDENVYIDVKNEFNTGEYYLHVRAIDEAGNISFRTDKQINEAHKVTYNYTENGGTSSNAPSGSPTPTKVNVGGNIDLSYTATKDGDTGVYNADTNPDGWKFIGWNTNKDATEGLDSLVMGTSDVTLYAIYKKDITLTQKYWDDENCIQKTKVEKKSLYNKNNTFKFTTASIPNYSGWTIRGWTGSETSVPDATASITSGGAVTLSADRTIYALYEKEVTATFQGYNANGVKQTSTTKKTKYTNAYDIFNEKIPSISLLSTSGTIANSFDGWSCRGWSTSTDSHVDSYYIKGGGSSYSLSDNVTFYAQYEKELTGTFIDYNGTTKRTREDKQKAYVNSYNIDDKTWPTITFPLQGKYSGDPDSGSWALGGYSSAGDTSNNAGTSFTQTATTTITQNSTYYGLYRRYITLTYDSHGGNSTPDKQTLYQSVNSFNINNLLNKKIRIGAAPSKTGFTFDGWRENSETGTKYSPDAEYTLTHTTTMHAAWIRNSYKVTYNYTENGGSSTTAGSNVYTLYQNNIDLSFKATKTGDTGVYSADNPDGWQFIGWNTDKDATTGLSSLVMGTEPVTLYAIYKKNITVTKEDISGTERQTQKTTYTLYNKASSKNIDLGSALSSAGPSYDRTHGLWGFRGWTLNICNEPVTWRTWDAGNHPDFNTCKTCGAKMEHDHPSPVYSGKCPTGHTYTFWGVDPNNTATCTNPNCGRIDNYSLTKDSRFDLCTHQGYEFTSATTAGPSCISSVTVSSDTTLYAMYERDMDNVFVSYEGTTRKSESVKVPQNMIVDPGNSEFPYVQTVSITMPTPYIYTKDGTWTVTGWSASATDEKFSAGTTVTSTKGINMYANYTRDLTATFIDTLNGEKQTTTQKYPATCHASNIVSVTYPYISMKTANNYGNGYNIYGWTESERQTTPEYSETSKTYLRNDTTFYAVYTGGILARFHYYETSGVPLCRENDATQKVNSSNPSTTMQEITISLREPENGYTDEDGKSWNFLHWSKETGNNAVAAGKDYTTIKQTTDFYAVYETTYTTTFQSDGEHKSNSSRAKVNAYAIDSPDYETVTAPTLKNANMSSLEWTPLGWTENASYDATEDVPPGTTLTADRDASYYAIYENVSKIRFVDYNGNSKRERNENLVRKYNAAGNISPSVVKTPFQGIRDGWEATGWTPDTHLSPERLYQENTEFSPEPGSTYYGFYKKNITLDLTSYRTTSSVPVTETRNANALSNSYNINVVRAAEFVLPQIQDYTVNEKTYPGICWTHDDNLSKTEAQGKTLQLKDSLHLYAAYRDSITVRYDGNGGVTYAQPSTQDKLLIASGHSYSSPLTITNDVPIRNGYEFLNKWGASKKETGSGYEPGSEQEFNSDTTLYAQWGIRTIDKTVRINWNDRSNAMDSRPENVYLTLYRNGEKVLKYLVSPLDDTVVSPSGNKYIDPAGVKIAVEKTGNTNEYTFSGLQQYNPETGTAYKYTVQEELFDSNNSQTAYEIDIDQSEGVITNTLVDAGNKVVKAKFQWIDDLNKWHLRPTTLQLELYRTDPDTHEKKLTSNPKVTFPDEVEDFEHLFGGQESINANGNAYEYSVVIPGIPNYSVTSTVTQGADGSTTCNFICRLTNVPDSFTGGNLNHVVLSADPYSSKNHLLPADKDDYLAINASENRVFMITLKPLKKTIDIGTGTETYHNTYLTQTIDTRTKLPAKGKGVMPPAQYAQERQVLYNVTVTPRYDVILEGLPDGKYEICPHNDSLFDFDKFVAAASEIKEAELAKENGKWYLTFSSHDGYSQVDKLHLNMIAKPWSGYVDNGDEYKHIYDRKDIGYPKYE